ncbi:transcription factor IIA, alpha/beta subunit [Multifurca ochricompacta]|uniref:Transcription initiation factor IIA large subunit n=1 Tax=Multifurca ochricompacta TaxID=376703 RepID=A0AAD4MA34_9AGAM|nr:transcription factor IIA, alpha/beta subunit [Multifurca ochricompacta]
MSNKIVPAIYRSVIDDVISSIKGDFDEYGVSEDVLAELQKKWETKVMASHVAEFEPPPAQQAPSQYPPHPMHVMPQHYSPAHHAFVPQSQPPPTTANLIKKEPVDSRYILSGQYVPPMSNPQIPALRPPPNSLLTFPGGPSRPPPPVAAPAPAVHPVNTVPSAKLPQPQPQPQPQSQSQPQPQSQSQPPRIPQVDGPSSSSSDSSSPPPQQYAPHSSHPSLPQPTQGSTISADDEAINSDLDDSDSEGEEDPDEGPGVSDIVFCTYDKVARVKNKWKCILKDGMIHINGKDYLFAKCTGEFEW